MNAPVPAQRLTLFSKRTFSFSNLGTSGTIEYVMVKAVDVTEFGDATLLVRVHSKSIDNDAKIEVIAKSVAPTVEEPQTNFTSADEVANVEVTASEGAAGSVLVDPVTPNFGGYLQIIVKGTQDSSSADDCEAVLSAELALRPSTPTKPKIIGDFVPGSTLSSNIGSSTLLFKRGYVSHMASGVLITSTNATLGEETFVQADATSNSLTLTLPSADTGWWYVIDYETIVDSYEITLSPDGSDDINGTAGEVDLPQGNYIFLLYSEDGTSWRAIGWERDSKPS